MDKSNQLTAVLCTHLAGNMNLARIKFLSLMILALCKVQTVNYEKLATAFDGKAGRNSSLRRIQRFIAKYPLDTALIARLIFKLLPDKPPYRILIDRTNWKFGKSNINIFMLSIAYNGLSFPLLYILLPKGGGSSCSERINLLERYITLFGKETIQCLLADREFIGEEWIAFLNRHAIPYYIRVKDGSFAMNPINGKRIKIKGLFNKLKMGQQRFIPKPYWVYGNIAYLSAVRVRNKQGKPELLVILSFKQDGKAMEEYRKRWQIESMFKALKTSGFNLEDTHLTDIERIERLLGVVMIAFTWAFLTGIFRHQHRKKIKILEHGRKAKSFFKYGLEYIAEILLKPYNRADWKKVVNILSCT